MQGHMCLLKIAAVLHAANAQSWPISASCPLLPETALCGGTNGDDLLVVHVLFDTSGSVKDADFQGPAVDFLDSLMKEVYCNRYNLADDRTKIWIATWNRKDDHETQLELGDGFSRLGPAFAKLRQHLTSGTTYPESALAEATQIARDSASGARNVVVFFTDGKMSDDATTTAAANDLKSLEVSHNVILITVGIGDGIDKDYLDTVASTPAVSLEVSGFNDLGSVLDPILSKLVCDTGGGGALEEPPTNFPTTGPPSVTPPPTTGAPIVTSRDTNSPTRSPIGDTGTPPTLSTSLAAPNAALGRASPLLLLATCALFFY